MAEVEAKEIKIRRVDFYPTDWLEGTISLTHIERSVYITIVAAIFAQGGPVEVPHVRRLCPGNGFTRGLAGLVEQGKVYRQGALLCQDRALREVGRTQVRVAESRANGGKGGRPINGLAKPKGSFSKNPARKAHTTTNIERDTSSVREVAARASSPDDGATHAHDDGEWKKAAIVVAPPPQPDLTVENAYARRLQQHLEFLGLGPERDLYLAAVLSDDDQAARRMFELTDQRMVSENAG